jgi:hypothetical protein
MMIKTSLLTVFGLLICYEMVIRSTDVWWTIGQNQWQANVIRANKFIYSDSQIDNVMVGSSISSKLGVKISRDSLPAGFYNLSFDGLSSMDGLLILQKLNYSPQRIFIESNMLMRGEDKNFQATLFSPILFSMKKFGKSLRENNQPVEVLSRMFTARKMHPDSVSQEPIADFTRDEATYRSMLGIKINSSSKRLPETQVRAQIQRLKRMVGQFQERGVQVIFLRFPWIRPYVVCLVLCKLGKQLRRRSGQWDAPLSSFLIARPITLLTVLIWTEAALTSI